MITVGMTEVRRSLSRLIDAVERGETVVITRRGHPVATLSPVARPGRRDIAEVIRSWLEYRDRHGITLGGLSIRELIDEGRRDQVG